MSSRARFASFSSFAALAALALAACPTSPPPAEHDGGPDSSTGAVVEIGTRADGGTFTPWSDEEIIPLVWGPQGGTMVTPSVAIDGALITAIDPSLVVQLTNYDADTGQPLVDLPGYGPVNSFFARLDRRLVNGPIYDQVGWTDIAGRRIRIDARVGGMGIDARGSVVIVLGAAGTMPPLPG